MFLHDLERITCLVVQLCVCLSAAAPTLTHQFNMLWTFMTLCSRTSFGLGISQFLNSEF